MSARQWALWPLGSQVISILGPCDPSVQTSLEAEFIAQ
jgi:hypothetical protein